MNGVKRVLDRLVNRLWIRLSFAFGSVILIGVTMVIVTSIILVQIDALQPTLIETGKGLTGIDQRLAAFYDSHGSWANTEIFLAGAESALPREANIIFTLQDTSGKIYSNHLATSSRLLGTLPITVKGAVVGTLNIYRQLTEDQNSRRQALIGQLQGFLLMVAAVGCVVGIPFGVLVSRNLTSPLEQLASAAQAIGARRLNERVQVKGSREIVAVAESFNNMAAALEAAEVQRRSLVADVAHELRTPLSVLQGNLLAIIDGVYPLSVDEIGRLYNQTDLLHHLVTELHELSLADAGQLVLHRQPTDVIKQLKQIVAAFEPTAEMAQVLLNLSVEPPDFILPKVTLDPVRLTQILDNLLGNALDHTPTGGAINIVVRSEVNTLVLIIKDTGAGISTEHLPHIFDRFYRTDSARSRSTGGSGLGLAIVRALVTAHGGEIIAESDGMAGHGTTFTIRLPM